MAVRNKYRIEFMMYHHLMPYLKKKIVCLKAMCMIKWCALCSVEKSKAFFFVTKTEYIYSFKNLI